MIVLHIFNILNGKKIVFLLLFFFGKHLASASRFEFTPLARKAYEEVLSLRFKEAATSLNQLRRDDPTNLVVFYIEDYIDFFTIFLNEQPETFKQLEVNKNKRLQAMRQISPDSPYYLFTQAEINLHWALARGKFEQYLTAFNEISEAYRLLSQNQQKFPDFMGNKKSLGIMHALIGTVPDNYKWGVKLLSGMQGSIEQGQQEIKEVLEYAKKNDFVFEEETLAIYTFLLINLKNQRAEAWNLLKNNAQKWNPKENPMAAFSLANVATRTEKNDEAIKLLENMPTGAAFFPFHYAQYMLGLAKLCRLDDDAAKHFYQFVQNFRGRHSIKEAYQKLAWYYLLRDDAEGYKKNIALCKTYGVAVQEGDKNALREAKEGLIPDVTLLKARLLFDGGYYKRAYDLLKAKNSADYAEKRYQLEYHYRLGRIAHKLNRSTEAVQYYQQTIDNGKKEPFYFACNAALQLGQLYEDQKLNEKAKIYYNLCLAINPAEHKDGLHQKAKAGLNRLKK